MSKRAKSTQVRIIAGQWRGRKIPVLDRDGLRPTTDRVRETLFNWLMFDLNGAKVLDLYAGSGALGLESLSRGAAHVDFVELDRGAAQAIRGSLEKFAGNMSAKVVCQDAASFIRNTKTSYEIVFLDPPFDSAELDHIIELLEKADCLTHKALIYVEQPTIKSLVAVPNNWQLHRQGKAGQSRYHLYQRV